MQRPGRDPPEGTIMAVERDGGPAMSRRHPGRWAAINGDLFIDCSGSRDC
jgi:hypothetical protein